MNILRNETGIAIIIASTLWGMAFYDGLFIVYVVTAFYFFLAIFRKESKLSLNIGIVLVFICVCFYMWGIFFSKGKFYNSNFVDILNIICFLMFLFVVNQLNQKGYRIAYNLTKKIVIPLMSVLSVLALYKYYMLTKGVFLPQYQFSNGQYIYGTSLTTDNNMFALAMTIALIMGVTLLRELKTISMIVFYFFATVPIAFTLIFSGSRRAYLIISIIIVIELIKWVINSLKGLKIVKSAIILYFIVFAASLFGAYIIFFNVKIDLVSILNDPQINMTIQRLMTVQPSNFLESFLPRSDRWYYSIELFYVSSLNQGIFGQGFNYLYLFVDRFPSYVAEDYPHNPLLSALLYSGMLGSVAVFSLITVSFYKVIKYKDFFGKDFLLIYFITFIFIFISGNSIFSFKLFIFLMSFSLLGNVIFKEVNTSAGTEKEEKKEINEFLTI